MEFDVALFRETFFEIIGSLSPLLLIMISLTFGNLIVNVFRRILDTPASRIYSNIEDYDEDDDEEYIDEDERENFYDFDNSIVTDNENPIKSK